MHDTVPKIPDPIQQTVRLMCMELDSWAPTIGPHYICLTTTTLRYLKCHQPYGDTNIPSSRVKRERERELARLLALSVAYINVGLEGWLFQRPSDTKGRLPCVLSHVQPLSLPSLCGGCPKSLPQIPHQMPHKTLQLPWSSLLPNQEWEKNHPTFSQLMHWVLGFNAKTLFSTNKTLVLFKLQSCVF